MNKPTSPSVVSSFAFVVAFSAMAFGLAGYPARGAAGARSFAAQSVTPEQATFFETKIRPVLATSCASCHGKETQLAGLCLDTPEGFRKGGDSGPCVVAGDPEKSLLIFAIRQTGSLKMPKGGKLSPSQVSDFEAWVKMGAPWPDNARAKSSEKDLLWSLLPVKKPDVPKPKGSTWVRNPIDAFVLARLQTEHIAPATTADRRTLIRRVTYDLTGLPPSPAEVDAFLSDKSPQAYDKVVDRLLASPRYGERWARHWMDVSRYADTKGYVFNEDRNYPSAYTYRDWLINAFNSDLPYDQFVIQQLAADRLPEVQQSDDKRPLAALGFLTLGRRFLNQEPDIIDDRIDVTMRGFEGFTVECARCHDHKFDPIPTQDYYSLYSVFASSEEVKSPISDKSLRDPWEAYNNKVSSYEAQIRQLILAQVKVLRTRTDLPEKAKQALQSVGEGSVPDGDNLKNLTASFDETNKTMLANLQNELADVKKGAPPLPEFAMAMTDRANPGDGFVFKRGNPNLHGDVAPRRFLLALSKPGVPRAHWTGGSGRLELAKAIASKDNPLTARVFVNRVWQDHFGAGIVRTPSDFGHRGDKPTDPALLDYLASTFMDSGWSIKKLQRLIVTSATYRQSSNVPQSALEADPDNRYWGRMNRRRLDLEEMRDSLMDVAGRLDVSQVGGKSVDLWSQPFTSRRAVYGFVERQNLPGTFRTFDFASPDSTSSGRFFTTVPQQALFFMNSNMSVQDAQQLSNRPEIVGSQDDPQRIRRLYRLLFERMPDADELALGLSYLKGSGRAAAMSPGMVWQYGFGEFDPAKARVTSFTPMTFFSDVGYHAGKDFPDKSLGYLVLNATGGHPGRDRAHEVIRRWVAPASMTVMIKGSVAHRQKEGDGVCARIVSSRAGLLGEWVVHNSESRTDINSVSVQAGDTLDFVVDPQTNDGFDAFSWSPTVLSVDGRQAWDASSNFGPPPGPPLSRLALYAQALMMTNEFMFVD